MILLARRAFPTQRETTSLVVGFNLPNDRSEVTSLVADTRATFGITIGVIDFASLLQMVFASVIENRQHNSQQLARLYGIISVSYS